MSCNLLPSWALATAPQKSSSAACANATNFAERCIAVGIVLSIIPITPSSIQASVCKTNRGVSFDIAADAVRNNFHQCDFRFRNFRDSSVVLTQVVAWNDAVNQPVRCLYKS